MKEIRVTAKKYDYYRQELKEIKQAKLYFNSCRKYEPKNINKRNTSVMIKLNTSCTKTSYFFNNAIL